MIIYKRMQRLEKLPSACIVHGYGTQYVRIYCFRVCLRSLHNVFGIHAHFYRHACTWCYLLGMQLLFVSQISILFWSAIRCESRSICEHSGACNYDCVFSSFSASFASKRTTTRHWSPHVWFMKTAQTERTSSYVTSIRRTISKIGNVRVVRSLTRFKMSR